jgi:hypothetical protein
MRMCDADNQSSSEGLHWIPPMEDVRSSDKLKGAVL